MGTKISHWLKRLEPSSDFAIILNICAITILDKVRRMLKERKIMKLLLTSAGIKNASIHNALVDMLSKPIAESSALCISTASYALPNGPFLAWSFITGQESETPMTELGWKSVGVLELTALPSLGKDRWLPMVQEIDVLLVNGGDTLYLSYWIRQSGLADLLPSLRAVYVGLSAGSMVMSPRVADEFVQWTPPSGGNKTLGLVDFEMFPHLDHPMLPENTTAHAEKWAAGLRRPGYAMDDETAIKWVDGGVEVISEGNWKRFTPT
jgi:dipeptidase E